MRTESEFSYTLAGVSVDKESARAGSAKTLVYTRSYYAEASSLLPEEKRSALWKIFRSAYLQLRESGVNPVVAGFTASRAIQDALKDMREGK